MKCACEPHATRNVAAASSATGNQTYLEEDVRYIYIYIYIIYGVSYGPAARTPRGAHSPEQSKTVLRGHLSVYL